MIRCPICPAFMIAKKIYDVAFHVCDSCGHSEVFAKPEAA